MNASSKNQKLRLFDFKKKYLKTPAEKPYTVSEMQTQQTPTPGISLHEFLAQNEFYLDKNITNIIEKIINTSDRKTFLLRGPAGVGKTQLTFLIAKWLDAEYVYFQCTYGADEDSLLYKYVPSEQTKSGIKITLGPVPRALILSQKRKVVLVLDEFDKTRPTADALLLDVLQNHRLSLYLNDDETTISGNPNNLIIFLTSNDMREFSEPLLRRLITITLKPLPVATVYEMLKKQFKENIVLLLAQIYDDTIKAGLRKPATIQELVQLGGLLENGVDTPLQDLLRMFVIKYDDDWVKFTQYVSSRKPYKFANDANGNVSNVNIADITQYYEPPQDPAVPQEQKGQTTQLLEKISRIAVKQPNDSVVKTVKEEVNDIIESTFKAALSENDFTVYTNIIKVLKPEPTDDPGIFGKFKIMKDTDGYKITAEKPLTLLEYLQLLNSDEIEFEGYVEDKMVLTNPTAINELLENASAVRYYTSNRIQAVFNGNGVTELIEIELENGKYNPKKPNELEEVVIRMYANVKKHGSFNSLMMNLISRLYDVNVNASNPNVLVEFIKQIIEYRKHHLNPGVGISIHFNNVEDIEKTMKTLSEAFKVNIRDHDIDEIRRKMTAKIYYNEYYNSLEVGAA